MIDMITSETINKFIMSGLTELKSVGSYLDTDIGVIYPIEEDGTPDYGCSISLYDDEVSSEWIESLSDEDYNICKPYLNL
jgi:hypothetical protein